MHGKTQGKIKKVLKNLSINKQNMHWGRGGGWAPKSEEINYFKKVRECEEKHVNTIKMVDRVEVFIPKRSIKYFCLCFFNMVRE